MTQKKLRNTVDDAMTFAELIGLPTLDDHAAIQIFVAGIPTATAAAAYRHEQLQRIDRQTKAARAPRPSRQNPHGATILRRAKATWKSNPILTPERLAYLILADLDREGAEGLPAPETAAKWLRKIIRSQ